MSAGIVPGTAFLRLVRSATRVETLMHPLPRIFLLALCAGLVLALASLDAQTGDSKTDPAPKKIPLDKFKMPPGGVVLLVEEMKDVRGFSPRVVLLTPEKYLELTDRIAGLEKQLKGERKTPYQCRMTATVEGDTVRLVADLRLQTDQPRASIFLGFLRTQLAEARIRAREGEGDRPWQPAVLNLGNDGYSVTVDKAGDYQLNLEFRLPLGTGLGGPGPGAERFLELALPGAAVTTLALDLAAAVKEVRWNKTNIEKPATPGAEQKHWELVVGNVTQLQVAWKEPLDGGNPTPLRMVRGHVTVRVEDQQVTTSAELTLTDVRGKAKEWRLWLPLKAEVKVIAPEGLNYKWNKPNPNSHVLVLNQPTTDPIKVLVTLPLPRALGKVPIGPFAVQDAQRQEGTIDVKLPVEARRGVRLAYHLSGSLEERELPRDMPGEIVAVFKYWDMPVPAKGATPAVIAKTLVAPLEVELKTIQGKVETHVDHALSLRSTEGGWQITATCKIIARPLDAPVDFLDVQLPRIAAEAFPLMMEPSLAGFPGGLPWSAWAAASQLPLDGEWALGSGAAAVDIVPIEGAPKLQRKVRLKWSQPQPKEFSVTLVGTYTLPAGSQRARLELPRPLNAFHDSGATTKIEVPDTLELLMPEGGPELPLAGKHTAARTWDRAPSSWELAWRPYRAEFPVSVVADVSFRPRYAHVKEQLGWDQAERPGKSALLLLKLPAEVKNLKVTGGGRLRGVDAGKQLAFVDLPQEPAGKTALVLEYDFPLPLVGAAKQDFVAPLIWPEQATQTETKVRLWGPPGTDPVLLAAGLPQLTWNDVGLEVVAGRSDLPIRVLQSEGPLAVLTLRLAPAPVTLPSVVVERALVQVSVDDEGSEQYRARFLVTKLNAPSLDVRLPIALKNLDPKFTLDGKEIAWKARDASGQVAHLDIDLGLYTRPVVLEITYQLPRGQHTPDGLWHTTLHPPTLEGQAILGKVLWQVTLPPSALAVSARGDATTEQRWAWRAWLPALEPALSSGDLEQWIAGQEASEPTADASLVSASTALEPLRILRVSRAVWFLVCSVLVLLPGLLLYAWPPRPLGWLGLLSLMLAGLGLAGWFWPEALPAVLYGALPGALLLVGLLTMQWMVHQRYRRQLVFMPGFTRVKTGSSLIRPSSVNRGREPSTIDVPPPPEKATSELKS
jgi:hypothetical protein